MENINVSNLPFGSKECGEYLKSTYANSIDEVLLIQEVMYDKIMEYDEIVENISQLEKRKKVIEHILQNELKEYETGFCKDRKITWKGVIKKTIDTKKIRKDYPELAQTYEKYNISRVFKINK